MTINFSEKVFLLLLLFSTLITSGTVAQTARKMHLGDHELFTVSKTTEPITIDGRLNEEAWLRTESRSLNYFYNLEKQTDKQNSNFRMLWDERSSMLFLNVMINISLLWRRNVMAALTWMIVPNYF